jgi:hypothetical protein
MTGFVDCLCDGVSLVLSWGLCCVSSQKWIGVLFFDACLFCMFTFPGPFSFSWSHEHLVIFPLLSLF